MMHNVTMAHGFSLDLLQGAAVYAPEKEAMVWKIKNFPGGKEFLLRCKFGLPSVEAEEEAKGRMPPIRVKFEIPYFTVSGIQVICIASSLWIFSMILFCQVNYEICHDKLPACLVGCINLCHFPLLLICAVVCKSESLRARTAHPLTPCRCDISR